MTNKQANKMKQLLLFDKKATLIELRTCNSSRKSTAYTLFVQVFA